jgi:RimJ/RimL family protein N-acetyltransferase
MNNPVTLHEHPLRLTNKADIAHFLKRDISLHIYEIGDLDPFFWPRTQWFGWPSSSDIQALVLLYQAPSAPTLLAMSRPPQIPAFREILKRIMPYLPTNLYAHLSPPLWEEFSGLFSTLHSTLHTRMVLKNSEQIKRISTDSLIPLLISDLNELKLFYAEAYPENWFDPLMLETGQYFGIRCRGKLIAAAGIHVYSPQYGVAAIGNIAILPSYRGRGWGKQVTAGLCRSLLKTVKTIGLNVRSDNPAAVRLYQTLGFESTAGFQEIQFCHKSTDED